MRIVTSFVVAVDGRRLVDGCWRATWIDDSRRSVNNWIVKMDRVTCERLNADLAAKINKGGLTCSMDLMAGEAAGLVERRIR